MSTHVRPHLVTLMTLHHNQLGKVGNGMWCGGDGGLGGQNVHVTKYGKCTVWWCWWAPACNSVLWWHRQMSWRDTSLLSAPGPLVNISCFCHNNMSDKTTGPHHQYCICFISWSQSSCAGVVTYHHHSHRAQPALKGSQSDQSQTGIPTVDQSQTRPGLCPYMEVEVSVLEWVTTPGQGCPGWWWWQWW